METPSQSAPGRPGTALHLTSQVTVRLLEVDTPETKKPGEPVQCYGPEVTRFTAGLLPLGSTAYVSLTGSGGSVRPLSQLGYGPCVTCCSEPPGRC